MTTEILLQSRFKIKDEASGRHYDESTGFLYVKDTPITKEQIVSYKGSEIDPSGEHFEPTRDIYLYRPREEIAKASDSFNGKPLMDEHHDATAEDPMPDKRVGAMMDNCHMDGDYLKGTVVVYDGKAIKSIEDGSKRELSADYYSKVDWQAGEHQGQHYDGIMRDIVGNHVALVEEGRAGQDVRIRDSKPYDTINLLLDIQETPEIGQKMSDSKEQAAKQVQQEGMPSIFAEMVYGLQRFCGDQSQDWCREQISKCIAAGNADNKNVTRESNMSDEKRKEDGEFEDAKHSDEEKTGEGAKDFYSDKEEEMKKQGVDDKMRKMCLRMMREAASHASGDSKKSDARYPEAGNNGEVGNEKEEMKDGCSGRKSDAKEDEDEKEDEKEKEKVEDKSKHSDAKFSDSQVRNLIAEHDAKKEALWDARKDTEGILGNAKFSDAQSTYEHACMKKGFSSLDVKGVPINGLKAMLRSSARPRYDQVHLGDSKQESDGLSADIEAIMPAQGLPY